MTVKNNSLDGADVHLFCGWGRWRYVSCVDRADPNGPSSQYLFIHTMDQALADRTAAAWAKRNGMRRPRVKRHGRPPGPPGGSFPAISPDDYVPAPVRLGC